jgi:hypothetical protein
MGAGRGLAAASGGAIHRCAPDDATRASACVGASTFSGAQPERRQHTEFAPSAAPTASPPPAPAGDVLATASIQDYLAARSGNITAAVYDADTGTTVEYHPGDAQDTASIVKVDIPATMLDQAQAAGRPLTESQEQLAVEMIEASGDEAADDLWLEVGDARASADFDSKVGMTQTVPNVAGYWGLTTTTALDQIRLPMQVAFPSSVLDPGSRAYELGLMTHIESGQDWGVSAGPPDETTVALKNG